MYHINTFYLLVFTILSCRAAVLLEDDFNFFDSTKWRKVLTCTKHGGVANLTIVNDSLVIINRGLLVSLQEFNPETGCAIRIEGEWSFGFVEDCFNLVWRTAASNTADEYCNMVNGIDNAFYQSLTPTPLVGSRNKVFNNVGSSGDMRTLRVNETMSFNNTDDGIRVTSIFKGPNGLVANTTVDFTGGTSSPFSFIAIQNREKQYEDQISTLHWLRVSTLFDPVFLNPVSIITSGLNATFQSVGISFGTRVAFPPLLTVFWGDETSENIATVWVSGTRYQAPLTEHTYNNSGNYQVKVVLGDYCGLTYNSTFQITTTDVATTSSLTSSSLTSSSLTSSPISTSGSIATTGETFQSSSFEEKKSDSVSIAVGVTIGILALLSLILLILFLNSRRKKKFQDEELASVNEVITTKSFRGGVKQISNVEVKSKLGQGNFGEVYLGTWNGTDVALKKLKDQSITEFENEATFLGQVVHPNCVQFLGIYTDPDNVKYLATEYLPQGDLKQFLQENKDKITQKDLLDITLSAARGLAYLEESKVLHRDIALRNLLCAKLEGKYIAKVSDFGLSRLLENDTVYESKSSGKIPVKWSAPEGRTYTSKSDVWSFGVTIWEIFSFGAPPYDWLSNKDAWEKISIGETLPIPPGCPNIIYSLYLRCCSLDPNNRPTFAQIVKELQELQRTTANTERKESVASDTYVLTIANNSNNEYIALSHEDVK